MNDKLATAEKEAILKFAASVPALQAPLAAYYAQKSDKLLSDVYMGLKKVEYNVYVKESTGITTTEESVVSK